MANNLEDLDLLFAFEELAAAKQWDVSRTDDDQAYRDPTTQAAWLAFEAAHGEHSNHRGQQLYAGIKKSSKYAYQAEAGAKAGYPHPFPVQVDPTADDGYVVLGGFGGRYRLSDVDLYVIEDGRKQRLS